MLKRMRLGMGEACGLGMPLGEEIPIAHDDTALPRIGGRGVEGLSGLRQCSAHAVGIVVDFHGKVV